VSFEEKEKFYEIKMEYCDGYDLRKFLLIEKYRQNILPLMGKKFGTRVCLDILYAYT